MVHMHPDESQPFLIRKCYSSPLIDSTRFTQVLPVVLWDLEHESAHVLDGAEPVPHGDRPHAVVRDLDGLRRNSIRN